MAKAPPDSPVGNIGERVCLRGHLECTGTVAEVTPREWIAVTWDPNCSAPKLCHRFELIVLPIDGSQKRTYGKSHR